MSVPSSIGTERSISLLFVTARFSAASAHASAAIFGQVNPSSCMDTSFLISSGEWRTSFAAPNAPEEGNAFHMFRELHHRFHQSMAGSHNGHTAIGAIFLQYFKHQFGISG